MKIKKFLTVFTISMLIKIVAVSSVYACFAVIIGRDASTDGSVLFGHLEQNGGIRNFSYRHVPRMHHEPGSVVQLRRGGTMPQPEMTYAYFWGGNTGVEFGDGYFNEWGVAVASDACGTREDSYDELVARGDITDGGIGYKLRRIIAQRATTAREGVEIATEALDHFGYAHSGRTYIIADADEAWILAVAAGKRWLAQRVPDDAIVLLPNVHILGSEVDLNDTENVKMSDGLVEYAISRGWYDPSSGEPFSFREAFNRPARSGSFMAEQGADPRQWFSQSLVLGELIDLPVEEPLPYALKVDRKFSVTDVANIIRSHGHVEGQEPDMDMGHKIGMPDRGTPHGGAGGTGNICSGRIQELVVYQLRNWMPAEIGSVAWRTSSAPCGSALVPVYAGVTEIPKAYYKHQYDVEEMLDIEFHFDPPRGFFDHDPENAFDVFTALENLIDLNYSRNVEMAREVWEPFEEEQFRLQPAIEKVALELMEEDEELALSFLTDYTANRKIKALELAKEMVNRLKTIHWDN